MTRIGEEEGWCGVVRCISDSDFFFLSPCDDTCMSTFAVGIFEFWGFVL